MLNVKTKDATADDVDVVRARNITLKKLLLIPKNRHTNTRNHEEHKHSLHALNF
jgi:hypothetical protein